MEEHGPWKIKSTSHPYVDPYIDVRLDQVIRPDGNPGQHVVVHMKPGVCILPMDADGCVHLTWEFHYGIGRYSLEAVSGGIEPGEDPDVTAKRELQEELGLEAARWHYLTTVDPFTTIMVSPTRLYLVEGLQQVAASPEGTEQIESRVMPLNEAVEKVWQGEITHAPTCILLMMAAAKRSAS